MSLCCFLCCLLCPYLPLILHLTQYSALLIITVIFYTLSLCKRIYHILPHLLAYIYSINIFAYILQTKLKYSMTTEHITLALNSSKYYEFSRQRLIVSVSNLSPCPPWPDTKERALSSTWQIPCWCYAWPLGNDALTVLCCPLFSPLPPCSFFHHLFSLYLLPPRHSVFPVLPYFFLLRVYGCLYEPKTPGRQSSSTVELLSRGKKLQSCTNNVPLNILDTIYF